MASIGHGWIRPLGEPSENVKHYYNILVAVVFFFVAQLLTCAWDQPFWATGLEFPGQIVAMIFVWLVIWAAQLLFFQPGQGLEKFYHRHLKAPVSGSCLPHISSLSPGKTHTLIFGRGRRRC